MNKPNQWENDNEFHPIIFYDGVCGLCNKFVDLVLKFDHKRTFRYAPLQGDTAGKYNINPDQSNPEFWSLIYVDENSKSYKSNAAINILSALGGVFGIAKFLVYIPESVRNWCYELVAKHRYRLFGTLQSCRIPKEGEHSLMLP